MASLPGCLPGRYPKRHRDPVRDWQGDGDGRSPDPVTGTRGGSPDLATLDSRSDDLFVPTGRLAGRDGSHSQSRSGGHAIRTGHRDAPTRGRSGIRVFPGGAPDIQPVHDPLTRSDRHRVPSPRQRGLVGAMRDGRQRVRPVTPAQVGPAPHGQTPCRPAWPPRLHPFRRPVAHQPTHRMTHHGRTMASRTARGERSPRPHNP